MMCIFYQRHSGVQMMTHAPKTVEQESAGSPLWCRAVGVTEAVTTFVSSGTNILLSNSSSARKKAFSCHRS